MKVISITESNLDECLQLIDELRADLVSGHLHAFHTVGVTGEGIVEVYGSAVRRTNKIAMIGALQYAISQFCKDFSGD